MKANAQVPVWPSLACVAALAALPVAATSVWRALSVQAVTPSSPHGAQAGTSSSGLTWQYDDTDSLVGTVLRRDPFRPERRPSGLVFRMPGEASTDVPAGVNDSGVAEIRLVGTAVSPRGGGFAICQSGSDPARLLRIGQSFGEFTLIRIGKGRAVFRNAGGTAIELQVPRSGT